jgi:DNA-binding transcriptional LysR family regulator
MKTQDPLAGVAAFVEVAERRSFSAAAERLGLGRATVSAQVADLERRLGVRLLQRSTRKVVPTEAGLAYLAAMDGVLGRVDDAARIARTFQTEAVGRLKVSASPEIGQRYIIPFLPDFFRDKSGLSIELELSSAPVDVLADGFDLAIRATIAVEDGLIGRGLGVSPITITAAPDYLARFPAPVGPEDLAGHACLHFALLRWGRMWIFNRRGQELRVPIQPVLEVNDGEALRLAALSGLGITLLPAFLTGEDVRAGRLVRLLPDWAITDIPLMAVYPTNRNIAAKVRVFVDFLARRWSSIEDFRGG